MRALKLSLKEKRDSAVKLFESDFKYKLQRYMEVI